VHSRIWRIIDTKKPTYLKSVFLKFIHLVIHFLKFLHRHVSRKDRHRGTKKADDKD
jgi:hypothetical protein